MKEEFPHVTAHRLAVTITLKDKAIERSQAVKSLRAIRQTSYQPVAKTGWRGRTVNILT